MFRRLKNYLTHDGALNIELFKILGICGVVLSFTSGLYTLITGDLISTVINFSAGILAIFLLLFVEHTGHYVIGYIVVEAAVFMLLFAVMFFTGSGMDGSMPYFFSFALMFTVLMFQGKLLIFMESLLAVFYLVICVLSIVFPQSVQESGTSIPIEYERLFGVFISPIFMGIIFLLYIREYRRQKQIAEEANKAKSIFLANMSHEIRTPIHAILGFNEMILRTAKDSQIIKYAGCIDQSGHHLLDVINEILEFSKIESGKGQLVEEVYSLRKLKEEMQSLMTVMSQDKHLNFFIDFDEKLFDTVLGDREKLVRILTNLLSNAFKYTSAGSVTLHIRLLEENERQQTIFFAIEDTGIGIKMSEINNLFHSYERADLMKNRNIEGTGLGLAITEQILQMMGTSVRVESTYGKGSTFSFELIQQKADSGETDDKESAKAALFSAPEAKILVVDDDEMNRRLMDSFLCLFRIKADFAESGRQCLERLKTSDYHLILMDYMMPGLDGTATVEIIRSEETGGKHTPIVVLTADTVDGIDQILLRKGFDSYLSKPVDLKTLEEAILKYIPQELLVPENPQKKTELPEDAFAQHSIMLNKQGIRLEKGLELVNGDFEQYLRIAEFFVNHAAADMHKMQEAADDEDLSVLRLCLHSLKSKAGSIGAEDLRLIAEKLEKGCREADLEFVLCGTDLVQLQWKRCAQALEQLIEAEKPQISQQKETEIYETYVFEDLVEELDRNLKLCEGKKARSIVNQMKKILSSEQSSEILDEIEELINEMEFDKALEIEREGLKNGKIQNSLR